MPTFFWYIAQVWWGQFLLVCAIQFLKRACKFINHVEKYFNSTNNIFIIFIWYSIITSYVIFISLISVFFKIISTKITFKYVETNFCKYLGSILRSLQMLLRNFYSRLNYTQSVCRCFTCRMKAIAFQIPKWLSQCTNYLIRIG